MGNYYWDWQIFLQIGDDGQFYWQWLRDGLLQTCKVAICAIILAFILGSALGVFRTLVPPAKALNQHGLLQRFKYYTYHFLKIGASFYVEIFRNIPLIVQLFIWYHIVPEIVPSALGDYLKQDLPAWVLGFIGLGLFTASRVAEQIKAALQTQTAGQIMAATALGLKNWQVYLYIRLPLAYRIATPTLTSEAMNAFKNSSVTFAVGVLEIFFQGKQMIEKTAQEFEILIVIALLYMSLSLFVYFICAQIEKRTRLVGMIGQ